MILGALELPENPMSPLRALYLESSRALREVFKRLSLPKEPLKRVWPSASAHALLAWRHAGLTLGLQRNGWATQPPEPPSPQSRSSEKKKKLYPLTRNYYENNSLRIIFRNFGGFYALQLSRTFSRNYASNSEFLQK